MVGNKLSQDGLNAWAADMGAPAGAADTVAAECGGLTHDDSCEAGALVGMCFKTVAMKLGVEM